MSDSKAVERRLFSMLERGLRDACGAAMTLAGTGSEEEVRLRVEEMLRVLLLEPLACAAPETAERLAEGVLEDLLILG